MYNIASISLFILVSAQLLRTLNLILENNLVSFEYFLFDSELNWMYANLKLIVDFYYYFCVNFISFCACFVFLFVLFLFIFGVKNYDCFMLDFFFSFSFFLENIKFYWYIVLLCIDPPTRSISYVCTIIIVDHKSWEFEFRSWRGNIVVRD